MLLLRPIGRIVFGGYREGPRTARDKHKLPKDCISTAETEEENCLYTILPCIIPGYIISCSVYRGFYLQCVLLLEQSEFCVLRFSNEPITDTLEPQCPTRYIISVSCDLFSNESKLLRSFVPSFAVTPCCSYSTDSPPLPPALQKNIFVL